MASHLGVVGRGISTAEIRGLVRILGQGVGWLRTQPGSQTQSPQMESLPLAV